VLTVFPDPRAAILKQYRKSSRLVLTCDRRLLWRRLERLRKHFLPVVKRRSQSFFCEDGLKSELLVWPALACCGRSKMGMLAASANVSRDTIDSRVFFFKEFLERGS
jgi:hypothetical protein